MQKKRRNKHRNILTYIILTVLFLTLLQNVILTGIVYKATERPSVVTTAKVTGTISMCINAPPSFNITCNDTTIQDTFYSCKINGSDPNVGQTLTFSSEFITNNTVFNITSNGWINFTPGSGDTGNHSVNISLSDDSECNNSVVWDIFDFNVTNRNDPPYLSTVIPDQEFPENTELSAFYLDDHFTDPDGDNLTYGVTNTDYIVVDILETSEVIFSATTCGQIEYIIFTATDPYNASGDSNVVRIECTIPEDQDDDGSSTGDPPVPPCEPSWVCGSWEACQEDNTQRKLCVDVNACVAPRYFYRNCTYVLNCFNGIQDPNEEGIDCGGPCPPCKCVENWTCSDWSECYVNNTQTRTCEDSENCMTFKNKPDEVRKCDYLAHCYNGIQDADEEGIDCGGGCPPCKAFEVPEVITFGGLWVTIALILIAAVIFGLILYRVFHKQIKRIIVKVKFLLTRKIKKQILIDKKSKMRLLQGLIKLEKILEKKIRRPPKNIKSLEGHTIAICRDCIKVALDIPKESSLDDLKNALRKKVVHLHLRDILKGLFVKLGWIERGRKKMTCLNLLLLVEEFLELLNLTSDMNPHELRRGMKYLSLSKKNKRIGTLIKLKNMCFDTYIALQFDETRIAKKKYLQTLDLYESLKEAQRSKVFNDLLRLEKEIEYADSIFKEVKQKEVKK